MLIITGMNHLAMGVAECQMDQRGGAAPEVSWRGFGADPQPCELGESQGLLQLLTCNTFLKGCARRHLLRLDGCAQRVAMSVHVFVIEVTSGTSLFLWTMATRFSQYHANFLRDPVR